MVKKIFLFLAAVALILLSGSVSPVRGLTCGYEINTCVSSCDKCCGTCIPNDSYCLANGQNACCNDTSCPTPTPIPTKIPTPVPTAIPTSTPIPTPTPILSARYLPSTSFSYGDNCDTYSGGCPLTSLIAKESTVQNKTANDFFLKSVDNGYNGKVNFEYWNNESGGNAVNVKYCDIDKAPGCKTDNAYNTQRHRVKAKVVFDGMGNSTRTEYLYEGAGAAQGLAAVETYYEIDYEPMLIYSNDIQCTGTQNECGWETKPTDACIGWTYGQQCIGPDWSWCLDSDGITQKYNWRCVFDDQVPVTVIPFYGYDFLGYPEVTVKTYQKNSSSVPASQTKSYYHQKLETDTCFRPSPLRGLSYKEQVFDVNNNGRYAETLAKYAVRKGDMFEGFLDIPDSDLNAQCPSYDPEVTVTSVMQTGQIAKQYFPNQTNPVLCTKSTVEYSATDPYLSPTLQTNYGKVDCLTLEDITTDGQPKLSHIGYTSANKDLWKLPVKNENWVTTGTNSDKYNHVRILYDNLPFDSAITYGNQTSTQTLVDGNVYSASFSVYDATYPWLAVETTDPLGRKSTVAYDQVFRLFPVKVTNPLGQSVIMEYDFNTTDTQHPNYGKMRGVPVKITDANNQKTVYVYDLFGRILETYIPGENPLEGDKSSSFSRYYYFNEDDVTVCDDTHNCLYGLGKASSPKMMVLSGVRFADSGTLGKIAVNHKYYDGMGAVVQDRQMWFDGEVINSGTMVEGEGLRDLVSSSTYNSMGKTDKIYEVVTDEPHTNWQTTAYDPDVFQKALFYTQYLYDGMGRLSYTKYADGSQETSLYDVDGNPLKTGKSGKNCNDGNTATKCSTLFFLADSFGQNIENQAVDSENLKVYKTNTLFHEALGTPIETKDYRGNVTNRIEINKLGRTTNMWDIDMSPSMTDDNNAWRYEYDLLGNLIKQTNPKGDVTEIAYDSLNRMTSKKINGLLSLETFYDSCTNGAGKICKSESYKLGSSESIKIKEQKYEYSARGEVVKDAITLFNMPDAAINGKTFTTEYTYDKGGRPVAVKYPGNDTLGITGETVSQIYNRSQISEYRSDTGINYVSGLKYNKFGQLLGYLNGNGISGITEYRNDNLRLKSIAIGKNPTLSSDLGNLINYDYLYETNGNVSGINSFKPEVGNVAYTYDSLGQLKTATGTVTPASYYEYDDLSNITYKQEGSHAMTYVYDYANGFYHRPKTTIDSETKSASYDQIGNMLSYGGDKYIYDATNRLVRAETVYADPLPTPIPTPTPAILRGDANSDGIVDNADYDVWRINYDTSTNLGPAAGDFSNDYVVDGVDYIIWRNNFGKVILVPTPTSRFDGPLPPIPVEPTATPVPVSPTSSACQWECVSKGNCAGDIVSGYCSGTMVCCYSGEGGI